LPQFSQARSACSPTIWQVSAIVRAQSGNFFEVTTGIDNALNGQATSARCRWLSDPYLKNGYQLLNPAAVAARRRRERSHHTDSLVSGSGSIQRRHGA
jgi:hypothetical protein